MTKTEELVEAWGQAKDHRERRAEILQWADEKLHRPGDALAQHLAETEGSL